MTPTPRSIDLTADGREDRHRRIADLEVEARTYRGPVRCVLCGHELNPVTGAQPCRCTEPAIASPDAVIANLASRAEVAAESARRLAAQLADLQTEAEFRSMALNITSEELARANATAAAVGDAMAGFVTAVQLTLAGAGRVPAAATAARVAALVRGEG